MLQSLLVHCDGGRRIIDSCERGKSEYTRLSRVKFIVGQFYCEEHTHIGEVFARFAFCKDVDTLKAAGERLQGLKKFFKK